MDTEAIALAPAERAALLRVLAPFADRIETVSVFGSRVLGKAKPTSDIDLVLYGPIDGRTKARIGTLFEESSLAVTVDVVRYAELNEGAFRRHVDRYARPLFGRDELQAASPKPSSQTAKH